jgi:hypothetical protein
MPIKQVFESDVAVYPLTTREVPRTGVYPDGLGGGIAYFYFSPVDTYRIYTMYIDFFRGLFTVKDPNYPGEFEIHLLCAMRQDPWPSWSVQTFVWNGRTGAFKEMRQNITSFTLAFMFSAPDGSIWATSLYNYGFLKVNSVDWTMTEHPVLFSDLGANIGSTGGSPGTSAIAIDPGRDVLITRIQGNAASQLSVCRLSNGDWLRTINMAGHIESIFIAEPPMAYAVETSGNLTAFNYETGEVTGVLHTGLVSGGFTWSNTAFTWDPFMRRVLFCYNTPDILPDGDCTTRVKGFYPIPLPVGMTPPIPLQYPQKGKTVPVFNRVYGAAAEGIVGQEVTYTVGDDSAATVSPSRKATENNGTVYVQLAGTIAGANSITSEVTVP